MGIEATNTIVELLPQFEGYVYPNESGPHPLWGVLIVLYPYITGLVAGAFIMSSLVRVFKDGPNLKQFVRLGISFLWLLLIPIRKRRNHSQRKWLDREGYRMI